VEINKKTLEILRDNAKIFAKQKGYKFEEVFDNLKKLYKETSILKRKKMGFTKKIYYGKIK